MDVRSIVDREPEVEHNGTVPVWYLVHPRELKELTDGGFVELINEFEVAAGGAVFPHSHPTHEWYFVMSGRGVMTVDDEERPVGPGCNRRRLGWSGVRGDNGSGSRARRLPRRVCVAVQHRSPALRSLLVEGEPDVPHRAVGGNARGPSSPPG